MERAGRPGRRPPDTREVRAPLPADLYELDPASPLLANYAHGSCPAGKYYCRITPTGDVTPCPYMPVAAGNLRETGFAALWEEAQVFTDLRTRPLGGRCGACESPEICGGCAAAPTRPTATTWRRIPRAAISLAATGVS